MGGTILSVKDICKKFGDNQVLFDLGFSLEKGEVHALIGENGAGKSTLMKILSGYYQPTSGQIFLDGKQVDVSDSRIGEALGIVLIHQEFNLAEHLTVEENIFLGREIQSGLFLDKKAMQQQSRTLLSELDCDVDPKRRIRDLSVSEKQMVEIAKAVSRNARILIMDEPTAVLTGSETDVLFRLIRRLQTQGTTIVYISHKLGEVAAIANRVTVLRDGLLVGTWPIADLDQEKMATLMVGRQLQDLYPEKTSLPPSADTVLEVEDFHVPGWVKQASFSLKRGEILGFSGLVGAGRTELMEGILGLRPGSSGKVLRNGQVLKIHTLRDAVAAGIGYLTEDRKGKGLLLEKNLRQNVTLMSLSRYGRVLIDEAAEQQTLEQAVSTFDIRLKELNALAGSLSGGNQQKVLLAKTMEINPEIIIIDEPTRGIDIGTKQQVYQFIHDLVRQGKSCIVISSEMQEVIGLAHRVVVMRSGEVTGVLEGDALTEQEIVLYATGLKRTTPHASAS